MLKKIKNRALVWFRKRYENRISLPYGITRFISNIAFVQLTHEEMIDLAPLPRFAGAWVTTTGMRPVINYGVFTTEWIYVQLIVELDRGFQIHEELPESKKERLVIEQANSLANNPQDMKPVPKPKFGTDDWEMATIDDPRVEPLKDMFLGFAFYAPFTASMKKRING